MIPSTRIARLRASALAVLACCGSGFSQEAPVKVAASFYAFDYAAGHDTVYYQTGPETFAAVELSKANIVGPVPAVLSDGALQLHSGPVKRADGTSSRTLVATTKVAADVKQALVVLFPAAPDSATPYRALLFEHTGQAFPLGTYRIINLAPFPIRGAIGKQIVQAKPGGVANLELKGEPGSVVPVRFEYFDEGAWSLLTETRAAVRKDRRWLMCIYRDPASGRLNMRSIPDRTLPVAAPAVP
jgi:hypothetical protein